MLNDYNEFVDALVSDPSKNKEAFLARIEELYQAGCDVSRLATAAAGLSAEAGEFMEIVKKQLFQGKPYNEDNMFHLKRELGDVMFYWMVACQALGISSEEVIKEDINKLQSRYPGGSFEIGKSEKRKQGDL